MSHSSEGEEKPKKAPRKRAVSRTRAVKKTAPKKSTRTRVTSRRTSTTKRVSAPAPEPPAPPSRKAPTTLAASKAQSRYSRNTIFIMTAVIVLGIGTSAAIGFSDTGEIDVAKTIEERNERIKQAGSNTTEKTITVPVQNTSQKADGGLRGLGVGTQKPANKKTASTTATSTEDVINATASSTDASASSTEEAVENDQEENSENIESTSVESATTTEPTVEANT